MGGYPVAIGKLLVVLIGKFSRPSASARISYSLKVLRICTVPLLGKVVAEFKDGDSREFILLDCTRLGIPTTNRRGC